MIVRGTGQIFIYPGKLEKTAKKPKRFGRDFNLLAAGQSVSILGSAILRFALSLYVLDITGRADIFALVLALSAIPGIVSMPIGGALADRFSRKRLIAAFDFTSGAVVLALCGLIATGAAPVAAVGAALAVMSLVGSMCQPVVQASIPVLVRGERLASANGLVNGMGSMSALLGPVLGGTLYAIVGLQTLVSASCAAFFLSAMMELFIRIPFTRQASGKPMVPTILGDMKAGLCYVARGNPLLLQTIKLAAALNLFLTPFFIVGIPYILRFTMGSGETMMGIGLGIGQLSMVLGALIAGMLTRRMTLPTLYKPLLALAAMLLPMAAAVTPWMLGLGYWPPFVVFYFFYALFMVGNMAINIYVITSVQKETPQAILGKVMSIVFTASQCAVPLGQALYGMAMERFKAMAYMPVLLACAATAMISLAGKTMLRADTPWDTNNNQQTPEPVQIRERFLFRTRSRKEA